MRIEPGSEDTLHVWVDNEWANEASDPASLRPGELIFRVGSTARESLQSGGGWISEVWIDDLGRFVLDFCDRDQLILSAAEAVWVPAGNS